MLLFRTEPGMIKHIVMRDGFYVIPRRDGHVLVGSTVEHRGFDKSPTDEAYERLKRSAVSMVPGLADCPIVKHWAGLRPGSKTGIPTISAVSAVEGLFVNSGHFRNGVVMGPASARLMADIVLQRSMIVEPEPYQLVN